MLRIRYTADQLEPGQLVAIDEDRGTVEIRVNQGAEMPAIVGALNVDINNFLRKCTWFQLWEGEILSAATPDRPLMAHFKLDPAVNAAKRVGIFEWRGIAVTLINPNVDAAQFAAAMNPAIVKLLSGAQWFQFYGGEIVDMDSPETPGGGGGDAGIHRGPLVQEGARRS